tara:strand:- start:360 stop:524 length:165 start_codon:yes stop_codon:yes gene_type:complete
VNAPFAYDRYVARFKLKNPVPLFLIIVSLSLLLGGCEDKPVGEDKPVEENQDKH